MMHRLCGPGWKTICSQVRNVLNLSLIALMISVVVIRVRQIAAHNSKLWISAPPTNVLLGHAYGCVMNTRSEVLRLYRRILHVARHWEASPRSEINSAIEQQYIKYEARRLFRRNKAVSKMHV